MALNPLPLDPQSTYASLSSPDCMKHEVCVSKGFEVEIKIDSIWYYMVNRSRGLQALSVTWVKSTLYQNIRKIILTASIIWLFKYCIIRMNFHILSQYCSHTIMTNLKGHELHLSINMYDRKFFSPTNVNLTMGQFYAHLDDLEVLDSWNSYNLTVKVAYWFWSRKQVHVQ